MTADRVNIPALRPDWRIIAAAAVIPILAAGFFFDMIEDLSTHDPLDWADKATYLTLQHLRTPPLDAVMTTVTELGDSVVVIAMTAVVGLWLVWHRAWRTLAYWLAALAGGSLINTAIKVALHRARPSDLHYASWSAFSFPSGHSTTNALLYGFLTVFVLRQAPAAWRIPITTGSVLLVGLIAFSRLCLGAHWLSDVLGGLAFGSLWLALLSGFYLYRPAEPLDVRQLLLVVAATLAVAGGGNIIVSHGADTQRYAVNRCLASAVVACDK